MKPKSDGVRRYHHTTVDIFFPEGEMKCRYCPLLETYSRNMCRRTGEYIVDTNGKFIAGELARLGINLFYQTVVGDNRLRLLDAVKRAAGRSDLVIFSGGLGPTADDITMAKYFKTAERPFVVVANKLDKLKKSEIGPNLARIREVLALPDDIEVIGMSCLKGQGRTELLGRIEKSI